MSNPGARPYRIAIVCGLLFAGLLLSYDYGDRGPHFAPAHAKIDRSGVHDLSRARVMNKVVGHIRAHYVDPERINPPEMVTAALLAVQGMVPDVLVSVDRDKKKRPTSLSVTVGDTRREFALEKVEDLYALSWKLMDIFRHLQGHVPPSVDLEDVEYAAVNGMLETLDPHSVLLNPQVYREMQLGTRGRFGGLGIVISIREGVLTVMSVMDGTPASRAGLESGDKILQIGEESTVNMGLNEAVNKLRGEPGSDITIQIQREGENARRTYTITREEIRIRAVDHHPLPEGLGYVRIRNFQGNTFDDLRAGITSFKERPEGLKGLVLDLRENPGGLLDQAIKVSDLFLADGAIVATVREGSRDREERHATQAGTLADLPVVVLINRGSASASEIVAGALKNNGRAVILGSRSFGKGSVQVLYEIEDAALKLTIAQYLTPGDVSIQSVGIPPDVEIQRIRVNKASMDISPDENDEEGEAGLDSHLDSDKTEKARSSITFRLLDKDDDDEKDKEKGNNPYDEKFEPDPLVNLATDILKHAPVTSRAPALVQATGLLERRQREEDAALIKALEKEGINWQGGSDRSEPKLEVSLSIAPVGTGTGDKILAGETLRLDAKVTNRGKRDAHRVHGFLASDLGVLRGREFVFGKVAAGKTRSWSTEVKLPLGMSWEADPVTLKLFRDGRPLKAKGEAVLQVSGHPRPRLSASLVVLDDGANGDGLIQRGERVRLGVRVTNEGPGTAESVLATIKNKSGEEVYIRSGRKKLEGLKPGASTYAYFELDVRQGLRTQDVQLELSVMDPERRVWTRADLALPVFPLDFPPGTKADGFVVPSDGKVAIYGGAHEEMSEVAVVGPEAALPVLATTGRWVRVRLGPGEEDGLTGWARAGRVTHRDDLKQPAYKDVQMISEVQPPGLALDEATLKSLVTRDRSITISGTVDFSGSSAGRRQVYIFRGEEKVFLETASEEAVKQGPVPFSAEISLEDGTNTITVIAREGPDDLTRQRLVVFRDDAR